jgi:hypothetical protein
MHASFHGTCTASLAGVRMRLNETRHPDLYGSIPVLDERIICASVIARTPGPASNSAAAVRGDKADTKLGDPRAWLQTTERFFRAIFEASSSGGDLALLPTDVTTSSACFLFSVARARLLR